MHVDFFHVRHCFSRWLYLIASKSSTGSRRLMVYKPIIIQRTKLADKPPSPVKCKHGMWVNIDTRWCWVCVCVGEHWTVHTHGNKTDLWYKWPNLKIFYIQCQFKAIFVIRRCLGCKQLSVAAFKLNFEQKPSIQTIRSNWKRSTNP